MLCPYCLLTRKKLKHLFEIFFFLIWNLPRLYNDHHFKIIKLYTIFLSSTLKNGKQIFFFFFLFKTKKIRIVLMRFHSLSMFLATTLRFMSTKREFFSSLCLMMGEK